MKHVKKILQQNEEQLEAALIERYKTFTIEESPNAKYYYAECGKIIGAVYKQEPLTINGKVSQVLAPRMYVYPAFIKI